MNGYFQYPEYGWSEPAYGYPVGGGRSQYGAGLSFGVPGWRFGDIGSKKHEGDTDWSTVAKIGLVVGGALAIFLIYRASKIAEPIAERVGEAGAKYLVARSGGAGGALALGAAGRKNGARNVESVLAEPQNYKLLTA